MLSVEEAEKIILDRRQDFGKEKVSLSFSLGRVLAEDLLADRDMPPFDRVAMDGIAICFDAFKSGQKTFLVQGVQAAGELPIELANTQNCIEIMTGAALPETDDTVVRYEDVQIKDGLATVLVDNITRGQNIHRKGKDKKRGEIIAIAGQVVNPAIINIAASVGATELWVKKLPKVILISTGNELVDVEEVPGPFQIRRSNVLAVQATLRGFGVEADLQHLPDDKAIMETQLRKCIREYDVIVLSGGISMGKFDHVPASLESLGVSALFYKVKQKPGKPFWFGEAKNGATVFAFPGNPVSTFLCLYRYLLPWLKASLGRKLISHFAVLDKDFHFGKDLTFFLQVKLSTNKKAQLVATAVEGNGSGDLANLGEADAFLELPPRSGIFKQEEVFRVWPVTNEFY